MKKVSHAIAMRIRMAISIAFFSIGMANHLTPPSWPLGVFFAAGLMTCLCGAIGIHFIADDAPNEYRGVKEYFIKNIPLHYAIIITILQYIMVSIIIWEIINAWHLVNSKWSFLNFP